MSAATMERFGEEDEFGQERDSMRDLVVIEAEAGIAAMEQHLRTLSEKSGAMGSDGLEWGRGYAAFPVGQFVTEFAFGGRRRQMRMPTGRIALIKEMPIILPGALSTQHEDS